MLRNSDGSLTCICHEHKPECDCVNLIQFAAEGAPSIVPDLPFTPNAEQQRFLWLHDGHLVVKWHWQMQGSQLQAFTERGMRATIAKAAVGELIEQGLMAWDLGHSVKLTDAGKDWCRRARVPA